VSHILTHALAFIFGFSCAVLLIARVSMRPRARRALKAVKLVKEYKAVVPKKVQKFGDDEEIRLV
jgi:hypothetical protein